MAGRVSRRRLLAIAGGSVAVHGGAWLAGGARAQGQVERQLTDEEVREILFDEAEPGWARERATIKPFWFQREEGARPQPHWPADNVSIDYAHLMALPSSEEPFDLTVSALQHLLAVNSLRRNVELPRLLFGLRGCMLAGKDDHTDWAS